MGLGKFFFSGETKKNEVNKTQSPENAKIFSGGVHQTKKDLRGKLDQLKTLKINGSVLKKEEWSDMMTDLVKARSGKITAKQLERDLYLKKKIGQKERARIMTWAKKNFVKLEQTETTFNNRGVRKIDAKETLKADTFVSPKDSKSKFESSAKDSFNRLGITSVQTGFKRGHGGSVAGMNRTATQSVKPTNNTQNMTQNNRSNLTRNAPKRGW